MYHTAVISFIFALAVRAAPTKYDECGPTTQIPTDPADSCSTAPPVSDSSIAFGVTPLGDNIPIIFDWTICYPVVTTICDTMANSTTVNGTWYFETSVVTVDYGTPACQMGFWLPGQTGSAPKPSSEQCTNIFSTMQSDAASDGSWYGSSVNLKVNPATGAHQYALPGGSGTGEFCSRCEPMHISLTA